MPRGRAGLRHRWTSNRHTSARLSPPALPRLASNDGCPGPSPRSESRSRAAAPDLRKRGLPREQAAARLALLHRAGHHGHAGFQPPFRRDRRGRPGRHAGRRLGLRPLRTAPHPLVAGRGNRPDIAAAAAWAIRLASRSGAPHERRDMEEPRFRDASDAAGDRRVRPPDRPSRSLSWGPPSPSSSPPPSTWPPPSAVLAPTSLSTPRCWR
jgi:hypothetical protein